jgi:hypothetical protein
LTLVAIDIAKHYHDVLIEPPPPKRQFRLQLANSRTEFKHLAGHLQGLKSLHRDRLSSDELLSSTGELIDIAVSRAAGGRRAEGLISVAGRDGLRRADQPDRRAERISQKSRNVAAPIRAGEVFVDIQPCQQIGLHRGCAARPQLLHRIVAIVEELGGGAADGLGEAPPERIPSAALRTGSTEARAHPPR